MLEINGNPNRRDLSERHARLAAEAGVMIVPQHRRPRGRHADNMAYAVATARRAWLTADQIANTRPLARVLPPAQARDGQVRLTRPGRPKLVC